jgi:hypothetical protein
MPLRLPTNEQLDRIERKLDLLLRITVMSTAATDQNFANLQAAVTAETTVEASAVTLIDGFAAQLAAAIAAANNGDSAALPALQAQIAASSATLAAAVTANTPAAPAAT